MTTLKNDEVIQYVKDAVAEAMSNYVFSDESHSVPYCTTLDCGTHIYVAEDGSVWDIKALISEYKKLEKALKKERDIQ